MKDNVGVHQSERGRKRIVNPSSLSNHREDIFTFLKPYLEKMAGDLTPAMADTRESSVQVLENTKEAGQTKLYHFGLSHKVK